MITLYNQIVIFKCIKTFKLIIESVFFYTIIIHFFVIVSSNYVYYVNSFTLDS